MPHGRTRNQSAVADLHAGDIDDSVQRLGVPSSGTPRSRARGLDWGHSDAAASHRTEQIRVPAGLFL